jgi:uncharacterized protein (TIGR02246 family)
MKICLVFALLGLAMSFASSTFAQQKDAVDLQMPQQIRALATKYDQAINSQNAAAIAAFWTKDGVDVTPNVGIFHGRQAIEKYYAEWVFRLWHVHNFIQRIDRVVAVGNEVHAYGTWSCTYQQTLASRSTGGGHFVWVIVREGNTWKIRKDSSSGSGSRAAAVVVVVVAAVVAAAAAVAAAAVVVEAVAAVVVAAAAVAAAAGAAAVASLARACCERGYSSCTCSSSCSICRA